MWLTFDKLTPAQAVVAQEQLVRHVDPPSLRRTSLREFWVVDGVVKGSRLIRTKRDQELLDALCGERLVDTSKTSLRGWTGGPRRWSLDP